VAREPEAVETAGDDDGKDEGEPLGAMLGLDPALSDPSRPVDASSIAMKAIATRPIARLRWRIPLVDMMKSYRAYSGSEVLGIKEPAAPWVAEGTKRLVDPVRSLRYHRPAARRNRVARAASSVG